MSEQDARKGEVSLYGDKSPADYQPLAKPLPCSVFKEWAPKSFDQQPSLWGPVQLELGLE